VKLFVDHNISFRVARAAHAIYEPEHEALALRDKFPTGISDVEYIRALGADGGWAVLTLDQGIRNRPAERAALMASKLTFFFLAPGWRAFTVPEQAVRLIRSWPKMVQFFELVAGGALVELPVNPGSKLRPFRP
jgi:PIN like domain